MNDFKTVPFKNLRDADLLIDAVYEGGAQKNAGDDPICKLVGCGNQGGFRYEGSLNKSIHLCVLYSELSDFDWPDELDTERGLFTYYGDNKIPGHGLHDTRRKGNAILQQVFDQLHLGERQSIPPFFVFTKGPKGRDVVFRGLAVPGGRGISQTEDLVAIWKTRVSQRFQNYRATFTILDVPKIPRVWIEDLRSGNRVTANAPTAWITWLNKGSYTTLVAPLARMFRKRDEQLPSEPAEKQLLDQLISFFKSHPRREYAFEKCAAELLRLMDSNVATYELTRPWRDGGRDAMGTYHIGRESTGISVDFALEAKCKALGSGSGVKETSRLISRLRHRQFGVFVTTSYVVEQAYKEIMDDGHPVLIISGRDIVAIMIRAGYNSTDSLKQWLESEFP